jgi:hypothetical protein
VFSVDPDVSIYYKIATASEPIQYTSTLTFYGVTPNWKATIGRVTGHNVLNPIASSTGSNSSGALVSTITIPSINTALNSSLIIAARAVARNILFESTPAGTNLEWSVNGTGTGYNNANNNAFRGVSQTIITAGATGTKQFSWVGTSRVSAVMIAINPNLCSPQISIPVFALGTTSERCEGLQTIIYSATSSNATSLSYSLDNVSLLAGNTINSITGEVNFI